MTIFNYKEMKLSYDRFLKFHSLRPVDRESSDAFDRFLKVPLHDTTWWQDRYRPNDQWEVPDDVASKIANLLSPHWYALMKAMIVNDKG